MATSDQILTHLRRGALAARRDLVLTDDAVCVRGAWHTSYTIELARTSSRLHLHYVVVQTLDQGCCYYEPAIEAPGMSESMLGADAVASDLGGRAWQIAALDAVYAQLCRTPDQRIALNGSNFDKASARAEVVREEVYRLLERLARPVVKPKVLNVGVVGDFLSALQCGADISLTASDYYQRIVDRQVSGVTVQHGSMTPRLVAEADIAIVTGMTLATGTLDEILAVARENGTAVMLFAQTGAHFAEVYLERGVATILAEPLPFYLSCHGLSVINVFRSPDR